MAKVWARFTFATQSGLKRYSFAEKWYFTANTIALATPHARDLAGLRAQLLGAGIVMAPIHLGDDDIPRASATEPAPAVAVSANGWYYYNPAFAPGSGTTPEFGFGDKPYASLQCRRTASSQYGANWYVGGAPDFVQPGQGDTITNADWVNAFNTLRDYALGVFGPPGGGARCALKVKQRDPGLLVTASVQLAVWDVATSALVVTVEGATGLINDGQKVFISRVVENNNADWPSINGTWAVTRLSPTTYKLRGYVPGTSPGGYVYRQGGTFTQVVYILQPLTNIVQVSLTKRDRGNSLFRVRGRAKNRKSVKK